MGGIGAGYSTRGYQRRKRNHVAIVVADVILFDVAVAETFLALRLKEDSPLSAEAVELIQKETAKVGLHRLIHIGHSNSLLEHLVPIDITITLWRACRQLRTHAAQLPPLPG